MKQKHNGGFTLIETVVAIAILGLITIPCTSGLLMSIRLNEKAQQMMQAQLAVSSAVETLMAEGIDPEIAQRAITENKKYDAFSRDAEGKIVEIDRFRDLECLLQPQEDGAFYQVTVECDDVKVTTFIRKAPEGEGGSGS